MFQNTFPIVGRRVVLGALLAATMVPAAACAGERAVVLPAPAVDAALKPGAAPETVVLAGGCFWGVQAVYQHTVGVRQAISGYAGDSKTLAVYDVVSTGRTQHAESVEVTFDPAVISYGTILQIFFSVAHNPTELNRQGPDTGPQYRSAIFAANDEQRRIAERYIAQLDQAHVFSSPIVTQVNGTTPFYPAEAYHQDYATLHPDSPYIAWNDLPKVENLKRVFADRFRAAPVLVAAKPPQG